MQLSDTKIFKPSNEEIIYSLLEKVAISDYFKYIDENGISKEIKRDGCDICYLKSSEKSIKFDYPSNTLFTILPYIYEVGRLIGKINYLEKCIDELMEGKKTHFFEMGTICSDYYTYKTPKAYSSIFKYAKKAGKV